MITNERQYRITKSQLNKFRSAVNNFQELELIRQGIDPIIVAAHRSALQNQVNEFEQDIKRYEALRSGATKKFSASSVSGLGQALIEARVAKRLSQKELGEALGVKEQQIQRYEQEFYKNASLARISGVAEALGLNVEASFLLRDQGEDEVSSAPQAFDPKKLPAKEMKKRGWLNDLGSDDFEEARSDFDLAAAFIHRVCHGRQIQALHRLRVRTHMRFDNYALLAWKARILCKAAEALHDAPAYTPIDSIFLKELVHLSIEPNGPVRAVEKLHDRGVAVVFERSLPSTHLDGAAMLLDQQRPVIGMTLTHDRLDNFWFVLMHEIAHIVNHRESGLKDGFFDDASSHSSEPLEKEADDFARNALISDEIWNSSFVRFAKSNDAVTRFASTLGVSAAIVSGRIRKERDNWQIFSDLVGRGEVRKMMIENNLMEA